MKRHPDQTVRVLAVWQPMLPTDWSAPATTVLARLSDRRVQQYWDPDHLLASQMQRDARPPQPVHDCCVRADILWDLAAVYPPGAAWSGRMPPAILFNGPVVDVAAEIEAALMVPPRTSRPLAPAAPALFTHSPPAAHTGDLP